MLKGNYSQSRSQITHIIEEQLQVSRLEVMESGTVWKALGGCKVSNADFSDHLLARVNESKECEITMTFYKKAAEQPLFELLK